MLGYKISKADLLYNNTYRIDININNPMLTCKNNQFILKQNISGMSDSYEEYKLSAGVYSGSTTCNSIITDFKKKDDTNRYNFNNGLYIVEVDKGALSITRSYLYSKCKYKDDEPIICSEPIYIGEVTNIIKVSNGGSQKLLYKGRRYKLRQEGRSKYILCKGTKVSLKDVRAWQKANKKA